ncbi:hypothetical protein PsW64_01388 [Pseudovibrio sp. W64]|nr:hypothetical protein PsAD46_05095 [Pseudovibrio sp. Ad46]KZK80678.1 hypothetical protein PsAD13_04743 [Pseudovibrio sp. Ad13]KZK86729.1 hypothetical protein PsW64_01388 [Pseudovibrio sp. W64]KZK89760.1 hypothetical protein PsAD5_05047 [Pseudovibrio sp. Ad5]KZL03035.1 hypothetical protein PsW74_00864 [Pseudovibrio sp. W74]KZL04946.1 hypothetical protein PsAD14_05186 [Pseudovibrio sp. Ad14]KZL14420.1 hypothetical protein PsAD37_05051 [Pseudovibrio sp. Ad37]
MIVGTHVQKMAYTNEFTVNFLMFSAINNRLNPTSTYAKTLADWLGCFLIDLRCLL